MAERFEGLWWGGLSRGSSRSNDALRMTAGTKKAKAKYGDAKTKYGDSELLSFAQNDELSSMGALPGISRTPPYPGG